MKLMWMPVVILAAALGMAGGYRLGLAGSIGELRRRSWCGWCINCSVEKTKKTG